RRPDRRVPGQPLPGCLRLHRAGAGADLPTLGPAGRARGRPGMSGAMKKAGLSRRNLLGIVLIGVALAVLPFVLGMAGQSWVRILNFALLYVMLALGLNIVVGFAGLLDLGYIAFYAVGAYAWALLVRLGCGGVCRAAPLLAAPPRRGQRRLAAPRVASRVARAAGGGLVGPHWGGGRRARVAAVARGIGRTRPAEGGGLRGGGG